MRIANAKIEWFNLERSASIHKFKDYIHSCTRACLCLCLNVCLLFYSVFVYRKRRERERKKNANLIILFFVHKLQQPYASKVQFELEIEQKRQQSFDLHRNSTISIKKTTTIDDHLSLSLSLSLHRFIHKLIISM